MLLQLAARHGGCTADILSHSVIIVTICNVMYFPLIMCGTEGFYKSSVAKLLFYKCFFFHIIPHYCGHTTFKCGDILILTF